MISLLQPNITKWVKEKEQGKWNMNCQIKMLESPMI